VQVFITGGSGLIGSAVISELLDHGHTVVGLARSDSAAAKLNGMGAVAVRGSLTDLDVIGSAADAADGAIHLAFANDFSSPEALAAAVAEEAGALDAIGQALIGSDRPFVVCSGTPWVPGRASTEHDPTPTEGPVGGRGMSVMRALGLAGHGVRTSAVRLPRTVHNDGQGGFAGLLAAIARSTGAAGYPGDGAQRWPAVHALDAASLFRLALENAPAGSVWHAVDDEGDTVRDIVEVIGRRLGLPVRSVPVESFGPVGPIFTRDQPSTSAHTRATLGWIPTHPRLLADLERLEP
jgi:nucleoside-diphosphate-sugar epimerase